jgi:hypothetical protein
MITEAVQVDHAGSAVWEELLRHQDNSLKGLAILARKKSSRYPVGIFGGYAVVGHMMKQYHLFTGVEYLFSLSQQMRRRPEDQHEVMKGEMV